MFSYRGNGQEDVMVHFLKTLVKCGDKIRDILKDEKKMIITKKQEVEFQNATICHICEKPIGNETKVRDHDHITGLYRGCAHQSCNVNFNHKNFQIPVFFHNLKGFDGHLIIQGLKTLKFENIRIIAQNFEKYMTFSFGDFRFLDSFAFMSSSIDALSANLLKDGKQNFKHTLKEEIDEDQSNLLLKKGVYPYEYMDSFERFDETMLPPKEKFYSNLIECGITDNEYNHAIHVWNTFNIKNLGEYHDLYLKTDVLLLTDIFETFRNTAMKNYRLDPANGYFTLANYAWDAMLLKTGKEIDQIIDPDMYLMCEQGIRGGTSMISHRYAKANNKYMTDYVEDYVTSYIIYLDANNLYGKAMSEKLPDGNLQWVKNFDEEFILNFDSDGDTGLFVKCDLHYPKHLHDLHNDYPLAVESRNIMKSELSAYQKNQMEIHNETHCDNIKNLFLVYMIKRNVFAILKFTILLEKRTCPNKNSFCTFFPPIILVKTLH